MALSENKILENRPRTGEILAALAELKRKADGFAKALSDLDDVSRSELSTFAGFELIERIEGDTLIIAGLAGHTIRNIEKFSKDKGGKTPNYSLINLILDLKKFYTQEFGRKAVAHYSYSYENDEGFNGEIGPESGNTWEIRTPFVRFLKVCVKEIDPHLYISRFAGKTSFGYYVREILRSNKKLEKIL
ncbi:MAG: hypothetical protein JSW07_05350 [bacterium]|nr:MAG: hypothetical protein JSW07_05350 [bacterium]